MKVLVTGATGFLGGRICQDLIEKEYQVMALGRNVPAGKKLENLGCEFAKVDLRDRLGIEKACENVDMIVHSGAFSSPWGKEEDFHSINVLGTKNVIEGAIKNQVKRLVYISTTSVYFDFKDNFNIKETEPTANPAPSLYTKTKLEAEEIVQKAFRSGQIETIILRPRGIFGPGDAALFPRLIKAHDRGRLPIIGNGKTKLDITYVGNVSYAVQLSLKANPAALGEKYNITNDDPINLWQTVEYILDRCGRKMKKNKIPFFIIYFVAYASEIICRYFLIGKEPTLTRYTAGLLAKSQTLDIEKAKKLLGYKPLKNMNTALEETITWYLSEEQNGA